MRKTPAGKIALGGIMAAAAVVVMGLGGLIPIATFVCPIICMTFLSFILKMCGRRIAWAWYGAVAILSLLLGPDKEAAGIFLFLGFYPIVKPGLERSKIAIVWKFLLFNSLILLMYWILIHIIGMTELAQEYQNLGNAMTVVMLIMGNILFLLLDRALSRLSKIR